MIPSSSFGTTPLSPLERLAMMLSFADWRSSWKIRLTGPPRVRHDRQRGRFRVAWASRSHCLSPAGLRWIPPGPTT